MKTYIRAYRNRIGQLVLTVLVTIALLLVGCLLVHGNAKKVSKQLDAYRNSDFSQIYVLNYSSSLENECIFVDADVSLFKDQNQANRLSVSAIMKAPDTSYTLKMLADVSGLQKDEILLSENVAEDYGLQLGDTVYAAFSYQSEMLVYRVAGIVDFNLDYCNPSIGNNIGLVYLGYNEDYQQRTDCKYLLFAEQSKADELSEKAQIIHSIINKTENESKVLRQGFAPIAIIVICAISGLILAHIILFSKSNAVLKRCYLKGMNKAGLYLLPSAEKLVFSVLPMALFACIYSIVFSGHGQFLQVFCVIPVCISAAYLVGSFSVDLIKSGRRDK